MEQNYSWKANRFPDSLKFPHIFSEPVGSLPPSQAPTARPYPWPEQSSLPIPILEDPFDVHVAVHRDGFLIIEPNMCTNFSKAFILE
jgi:hypothetical protein